MKIRNNLVQFNDKDALIVATGKQDAIFYTAHNGEIFQVESFQVDKPTYADIEGHFETRAKTGTQGQTMRAGSPYDPTDKNEKAVSDFLKELEKEFESVSRHHSISHLYLFAPSHLKNDVYNCIPHSIDDAETLLIEGNHYDTHPFKLLEKIQQKEHKEPVRPIKEAAQKILNKFKK